MHIDTGSGRVSLDLLSNSDDVNVDTGSGGVVLRVPKGFGAEFVLDTGSGGIDVGLPHEVTRRERGHLRGRIGDGHARLRVDTGSGGIRVLRAGGGT